MSEDGSVYRVEFYDKEENQILSYYSSGAPCIKTRDIIYLKSYVDPRINGNYMINGIKYDFEIHTNGKTNIYIEILVKKIKETK